MTSCFAFCGKGRTILGHQAAEILCARLPQLVNRALNFTSSDVNKDKLRSHVECVEDQDALRKLIVEAGGYILER